MPYAGLELARHGDPAAPRPPVPTAAEARHSRHALRQSFAGEGQAEAEQHVAAQHVQAVARGRASRRSTRRQGKGASRSPQPRQTRKSKAEPPSASQKSGAARRIQAVQRGKEVSGGLVEVFTLAELLNRTR